MPLVGPAVAPARIWEQHLPEVAEAVAVQPRQCRRRQLVVVRARLLQEERLPRVVPAADVDGVELALRAVVQHPRPALHHQQRQQPVALGVEAAARQARSNLNVPSWIRAQRWPVNIAFTR